MNIENAIKNLNLLIFQYQGYPQTIEPHIFGVDDRGRHAVLGYEVTEVGQLDKSRGWRFFYLSEMFGLSVSSTKFNGPRSGYKRSDKRFRRIIAQI